MMKSLFLLLTLASTIFCQDSSKIEKAVSLFKNNYTVEAQELFDQILKDESKIDSLYYFAGLNQINLENYEEASELLERATELNPRNAAYFLNLGHAYGLDAQNSSIFSQLSLATNALEAYEKSYALDPYNIEVNSSLANYYYKAPGIAGGDYDLAVKHAKVVKSIDELSGSALLADIYLSEEKFAEAENEFIILENKFGADSTYYYLYNSYGYMLLNQNRVKEAIEKFEKQVALAPENANAYDSLGDGYLALGDKKKAAEAFRRALQLNPNYKPSREKLEDLEN